MRFVSNSEEDTKKLGKEIASKLEKGMILVLSGDLGSGKTKFTEGILSYFGLENEISSPTFTIVNEYDSDALKIYHFDVYRIEDEDEFYAIGGDEYFEKGVSIIEWGEKIASILPDTYIQVNFSRDDKNENTRIIDIEGINI